jgi:hypothetical protein
MLVWVGYKAAGLRTRLRGECECRTACVDLDKEGMKKLGLIEKKTEAHAGVVLIVICLVAVRQM